ncbi:MAG: gliding motility lipoprotein GldH [Prevotella sp.]|jgi:gliding motility-associated lipoprotein GldH|nr:gliding motility lipoprotein GldH [Prevotella sp.]
MTRKAGFILSATATLLVAVMLPSCNLSTVFNRYESIDLSGWSRNDTLFFDVPPISTPGRFTQELGMRIDETFPFTGITLVVEQRVLPGRRTKTDTLKCRMADSEGAFTGTGVTLHQYDFPLGTIDLRRGDSLHITVRHIMERESMPGVSDVGIKLTRN